MRHGYGMRFLAECRVDLASQVVLDDLAELGVVHDSREDLLVLVHLADEHVHEDLVEPEAEVLQRVRLRLVREGFVGGEFCFDLVEEELVRGGEVGAEAFVEDRDDLGERGDLRV